MKKTGDASNRVAVYFRCSTDNQDKSIGDQRSTIVDYSALHNLTITTWFDKDEGKSGTSFEKRPDFMRMIRTVESGVNDFTTILVYDVDRWGRPVDPDESAYWEYHLKRFGVRVKYILDETLNDNSMAGRLTKKIKQELASEESHKQSLRVRERSKMRVSEGFRVGGFAPYGYKRLLVEADGTPIRVLEHGERKYEKTQRVKLTAGEPDEIDVVRRIFEMRAEGKGPLAIANQLNDDGIPSPGASRPYAQNRQHKWCQGTIRAMIRNPIYLGKYAYNRQIRGSWARQETSMISYRPVSDWVVKEKAHEPIVSPELFELAQIPIASGAGRRPYGRGRSSDYLLSGVMVCVNCGYSFHGHRKTNCQGKVYRYYEDSGYKFHGTSVCVSNSISADKLEKFILKKLDRNLPKIVDEKKLRKQITKNLRTLDDQNDSVGDQAATRLSEIRAKIDNLARAVESGGNFEPLLSRMASLKKEEDDIVLELMSTESPTGLEIDVDQAVEEIISMSEQAFTLLGSESPEKIKRVLPQFLNRVEVDPIHKKATFFVYNVPRTSTTYDQFVSDKKCRRSDSNRHDVAIGGF